VLRSHYIGPMGRAHSRSLLALIAVTALSGCSMSVPMLGEDGPATTGSIAAPVQVQKPLPQTLAYSDATKIGQTAVAALWQVDNGAGEWVNSATGSSGTVEKHGEADQAESAADCRGFDTLVTSIGGVHSYSGKICRGENGRSVVEIDDSGASRPS
jgi:hypothetical protein